MSGYSTADALKIGLQKAGGVVEKKFLSHIDVTTKLKKADKSFDAWDDETDGKKLDKLKQAALNDNKKALHDTSAAAKTVQMAVKANTDDRKLHKALDDLLTVVSMSVLAQLQNRNKRLTGGH